MTKAPAATNISPVAPHPSMLKARPFVWSPIISRRLEEIMINTITGGDSKPLITAVQKRAAIGFSPMKLMRQQAVDYRCPKEGSDWV
jgi:hypothetical protein